jgi:hypothetical protein
VWNLLLYDELLASQGGLQSVELIARCGPFLAYFLSGYGIALNVPCLVTRCKLIECNDVRYKMALFYANSQNC